jgi:hypothetical protein
MNRNALFFFWASVLALAAGVEQEREPKSLLWLPSAWAQSADDEEEEPPEDSEPPETEDPGADPADDPADDPGEDPADDPAEDGDLGGDDAAGDAGDDDATGEAAAADDDDDTTGDDADDALAGGAAQDDDDDDGDDDDGDDDDDSGEGGVRALGERGDRSIDEDDTGRGRLASGFELADDEAFDDDGYLSRRGEIIALRTSAAAPAAVRTIGLRVIEQQSLASLGKFVFRLETPAGAEIAAVLESLRAEDPEGRYDFNHLYDGASDSEAELLSLLAAGADRALVASASSLSVGLIDTAVDPAHPELRGVRIEQRPFSRTGVGDAPSMHGTAVASVLVGPRSGLLPGARLQAAGVFYRTMRGDALSEAEDLVRALDWLVQSGVPVINMSLSGPPNSVLEAAIARAVARGHLVVAAVGNAGPAAPPLYPAAYPAVVAVTAIDAKRQVYRRANRGEHVDFSALGVSVEAAAARGGKATYSGTSFATPYVAAVAALELQRPDKGAADAALVRLRSGALDLGLPGPDAVFGFGLVQPSATPANRVVSASVPSSASLP